MNEIENMREALRKIAQIAGDASGGESCSEGASMADEPVCVPVSLPEDQAIESAQNASQINPMNAPLTEQATRSGDVQDPARLAVLTSKYWGPAQRRLTVSFIESTPADLRKRIIKHMNAWNKWMPFASMEIKMGGIEFVETSGIGEVRISREGRGYWSYLGTDVLLIPQHKPTMNLQGFTMNSPEADFLRVVRHETGHTLGFPHEHLRRELIQRIDPEKAYAYFARTSGWDRDKVDNNVLTPLEESSIMGTEIDETSVMCYQLPGEITRDGVAILGGPDISGVDRAFALRIYPIPGSPFGQT